MKKFCFDTSGISTSRLQMPEDIHASMWTKVKAIIAAGEIAVTQEIFDEMEKIPGELGEHIKAHKAELVLEVGANTWDFQAYKAHMAQIVTDHHDFISEYTNGSPRTVCLNDISTIALAKTIGKPVVSMEGPVQRGSTKRHIPDVCLIEGVQHMNFSEFLRAAQIRL